MSNETADENAVETESYPRLKARANRFTLGTPRGAVATGDGSKALFLRSRDGFDPVQCLWISEFVAGESGVDTLADGFVDSLAHRERLLFDPRNCEADNAEVPAEEKARRERSRESAGGVTGFSIDEAGSRVVFALDGQLWSIDIGSGNGDDTDNADAPTLLNTRTPVIDPQIAPDGSKVAYSTGKAVYVYDFESRVDLPIVNAVPMLEEAVSYGLADFIAGEEMDRYHGMWWSPDSRVLLVQRTDESMVPLWHISDPVHPERPAREVRYPRALTMNARVDVLSFVFPKTIDDSTRLGEGVRLEWDHNEFEYLAAVSWASGKSPLMLVQNRKQDKDEILVGNVAGGSANVVKTDEDPRWLEIVEGLPARAANGELLSAQVDYATDSVRIALKNHVFTPAGWQIFSLLAVEESGVIAVASQETKVRDVVRFGYDGLAQRLNTRKGLWTASVSGIGSASGYVLTGRVLESVTPIVEHHYIDAEGAEHVAGIESFNAVPGFVPNTEFFTLGERDLETAITWPSEDSSFAGASSLPILLEPYGGPGSQEVLAAQSYYLDSQWWADQGFIVVTVDGRGTPGRGVTWAREIFENFADVTLADQVGALKALKELTEARALPTKHPLEQFDFDKVAMIGWSYGGYLSALSVLRAPDYIKAAVAGAPPTDWTLYDTHYTERYLGLDPAVYRRNSLIDDAPNLTRPLLFIHGFADDNVSIANTLKLSQALLSAGKQHYVLPLNGITHMATDPVVAENLLLEQLHFLREALS
jgi:dipeptidyl-peptidase-4